MARVMDFNQVQSSFWDITLRDKDRTVVHLDLPNEALINKLENMQTEIAAMKTGTQEAVKSIYDFAADLINCNFDYFTCTGEELATKYDMNMVIILQFISMYMNTIEELKNAKN